MVKRYSKVAEKSDDRHETQSTPSSKQKPLDLFFDLNETLIVRSKSQRTFKIRPGAVALIHHLYYNKSFNVYFLTSMKFKNAVAPALSLSPPEKSKVPLFAQEYNLPFRTPLKKYTWRRDVPKVLSASKADPSRAFFIDNDDYKVTGDSLIHVPPWTGQEGDTELGTLWAYLQYLLSRPHPMECGGLYGAFRAPQECREGGDPRVDAVRRWIKSQPASVFTIPEMPEMPDDPL